MRVARIRASWMPGVHKSSANWRFFPMRLASACKTGAEIPKAFGTRTRKQAIFSRTRGFARRLNSRSTRALVQRSPPGLRGEDLEGLVGIEEDRDGAFIDQLHGHHCLKNSGGYGNAKRAQRGVELLIESGGFFGWRGGNKAGTALPARVAI